jgi:hypothetical protein
MDHIKDMIGSDLNWVQPTLDRRYELISDRKVFGRLEFGSILGSLGTAESHEGSYTFKRQGFLRPSISIRRIGNEIDHGRMTMDSWHQGGVVHLQDGGSYQFVKMGFLHPEWSMLDGSGRPLVRIRAKWGLKYRAEVHIEPFGKDDKNLVLLLMVGLYSIILMNDEASAVAAASA